MGCSSSITNSIYPPPDSIKPDNITDEIIKEMESFKTIKKIGKGAISEVYLIKSKKTQKEYALKAIKIKNIEKKIIRKMKDEVDNLKILDHPNIISFKCAFESNIKKPLLNIITEYADNGDLEKRLKKQKEYFEENQLLDWLMQSCLALNYVHKNNILHRDIKPANIFLMKNDTIKLGDFGLSKKSELKRTYTMVGSPLYLAPEIINKKAYTSKVDIWSLGVTFCHLMTLEFPFEGKTIEKLYDNIINMNKNKKILNKEKNYYKKEIVDKYSKEFLNLIDELMSYDPEKRPTTDQILEKNIINERMKSYLKENNYNSNEVENKIKNYKQKEEEEKIKDNFEEKNNKLNIIIEEMKEKEEIESIVQTMEVTPKKNNEKINYDFLRQLSFINQSLHRALTQKKLIK